MFQRFIALTVVVFMCSVSVALADCGCTARAYVASYAPAVTYAAPATYTASYAPAVTYAAPVSYTASYAPAVTYAAPVSYTASYAPAVTYAAPVTYTAGYAPVSYTSYYAPTAVSYATYYAPEPVYCAGDVFQLLRAIALHGLLLRRAGQEHLRHAAILHTGPAGAEYVPGDHAVRLVEFKERP